MKPSFGMGILVAVLLAAALALLGQVSLQGAVTLGLILAGLWTVLSAFVIVDEGARSYYLGWGVIIIGLSLTYFIPVQYAVGLVLIAIVGLIIATAFLSRAPKATGSAAGSPAGGQPSPAS
ncbi:MAG: hypothetical protein KGI26_00860 [Thaumarchaeota archaeon]|nr:hypothetical protein [Nitrososphaerota archaeon]